VDVERPGYLPPADIAARLATSHVFVSVRDRVSPRSGSTASAFACGLPVVGFVGRETCGAVTRGGVLLAPEWDADAVAALVEEVADSDKLRAELATRSREAYEKLYSWTVHGPRIARFLYGEPDGPSSRATQAPGESAP
jgi:glycosyltransferase involved in cell wall biosynthesis